MFYVITSVLFVAAVMHLLLGTDGLQRVRMRGIVCMRLQVAFNDAPRDPTPTFWACDIQIGAGWQQVDPNWASLRMAVCAFAKHNGYKKFEVDHLPHMSCVRCRFTKAG